MGRVWYARIEPKVMDSQSPGDFLVSVKFMQPRVVLFVEGDLDVYSAPELSVVLDAVIDRGHRSLGLDLIHCLFIDTSGVQVIEVAAERLRRSGGALTVRSPSALTGRLLASAGLAQLTDVDFTALDVTSHGSSPRDITASYLASRVDEALDRRHIIALAQGVLMERDGLSEEAAFTALRRFSVRSGRPLRERAADIAASTSRPFPDVAQSVIDRDD